MDKTFHQWVITLLLVITGITSHYTLEAQSNWELKKDKDNIRIYTRSQENSKFNELKAVFDLPGTIGQLKAILENVADYKNWVYATALSTMVEKKSDSEIIYYSRISAPWPVTDREFYSDTHFHQDAGRQWMKVSSRNVDSVALTNHLVRIPFLRAEWVISVSAQSMLHVEYTLIWNPGGSIPAWLANMFCTTAPFQSFSQLKKKMTRMNCNAATLR